MTTWNVVLLIAGIIAALFGLCAVAIWVEKNYPADNYDERQKQAQGNAYRLTFVSGFVYYLLIAVGCNMENASGDTWFMLILYGLLGQAMILHIYGFLTHTSLPLDDKPILSIVGWMLFGIVDLIQFFTTKLPDGVGMMGYTQLVIGICFIGLSVMHLISYLQREKE